MTLEMILRRLSRFRRVFLVLLVAMLLVTAFFSLAPLYLQTVTESALRYVVDHATPGQFNLMLRSDERIGLEAEAPLRAELNELVTEMEQITYSASLLCGQPSQNVETCLSPFAYRPISFSRLEERFTLTAGRLPETQDASLGQVEGVVTETISESMNLQIGDAIPMHGTVRAVDAIIVGIVSPVQPEHPFWNTQRLVLTGQITFIGVDFTRFDIGVIVNEDAYDSLIAPISSAGTTYLWYIETNPTVLHADTLDAVNASLDRVQEELRVSYPSLELLGEFRDVVARFQADAAAAAAPVFLLSAVVMLLMLYQLVTVGALILRAQTAEWAALVSRGGSIIQLARLQFVTVCILGLVAFIVGPFGAVMLLRLFGRTGPLREILSDAPSLSLPLSMWLLSAAAAGAAILILTLPAWSAARAAAQRLTEIFNRPPTRAVWTRYGVDFMLLIVGFLFLVRLYLLIGGDAAGNFGTLLRDPGQLVQTIAVASRQDVQLLSDPFNIAAVVLLVVGTALLWLRVFPLFVRLVSAGTARLNSLTIPLAMWNVERDPHHFAHLVMLLIGTLALGTASLALNETHQVGAQYIARQTTGADVRLTYAVTALPIDWESRLPNLVGSTDVMQVSANLEGGRAITLLGIDPAEVSAMHPQLDGAMMLSEQATPAMLPGRVLPEDAAALSIYMRNDTPADEADPPQLMADVEDALGVLYTLPMIPDHDPEPSAFTTYVAQLPETGMALPWRFIGLRFLSRQADAGVRHTLLLDDFTLITTSGETLLLDDFDGDVSDWSMTTRMASIVIPTRAASVSGANSLQVRFVASMIGARLEEPQLTLGQRNARQTALPVIVSEEFARVYAERLRRASLQSGDTGEVEITLVQGTLTLPFHVVEVVETFPSLDARMPFLAADVERLRPLLNTLAAPNAFYNTNQVWLDLDSREPSPEFQQRVATLPDVTEAAYAWDAYNLARQEPLTNALVGMLYVGFWVALALSLMDFAFYLAMTARQRAASFAALRAMGWQGRSVWVLLLIEQAALILPAIVIGVAVGALLALILLPFLALLGAQALRLPAVPLMLLLLTLISAFVALLSVTALVLQRRSIVQGLKISE